MDKGGVSTVSCQDMPTTSQRDLVFRRLNEDLAERPDLLVNWKSLLLTVMERLARNRVFCGEKPTAPQGYWRFSAGKGYNLRRTLFAFVIFRGLACRAPFDMANVPSTSMFSGIRRYSCRAACPRKYFVIRCAAAVSFCLFRLPVPIAEMCRDKSPLHSV